MQRSRPGGRLLCTCSYELLLLGGLLLGATLLLRGLLRGFLFHGHGTISSTGVEHPCDPPVDRRASDRAPRGYSADSLCARTARTNTLTFGFVRLPLSTIECVGLLRDETNSVWQNLYALRDEFHQTASLKLVKLKSRTLIGGTTMASPGPPASLALTRSGRPIASRLFSM
jgi:hypothetical protein